jgi:DNA gyrase subunit B
VPTSRCSNTDGGISEFAEFLAPDPPSPVWRLQGSGTFTETVPVLDERGHMTPDRGRARVCRRHRVAVGDRLRHKGQLLRQHHRHAQGRHPRGRLRAGPAQGVPRQLELNARRLKVGADKVEKDDILAGLTAVVTVRLAEPQFEGQTKEVLGTAAVRAVVAKVVEQELTARLTSTKRDEKAHSALLLEKVVSEMKARISARQHKETQRRKTALESSTLPAKLADCRTHDVERSELFIVEGDSALGTAKLARPRITRRCCRSGARSSTSRRRRSPTCSRTPSAPRSSRSSGPGRGAPSISRRPATARSSS